MNKHQRKNRRLKHQQIPPTQPPKLHDDIRRRHFDPITGTASGGVVWRDYGNPRRIVVTEKGESPLDVIARENREYLLCGCGCGRPVPEAGAFIEGHKERMTQGE